MKKIFYSMGMIAISLAAMIEEPYRAQMAAVLAAIVCLSSAKALDEIERRRFRKIFTTIKRSDI